MHDLGIPKSFGSILKAQSLCAAVFRSLVKIKLMKPYLQLLQREPLLVHTTRRATVKTEQHVPSPMSALWCAPDFQSFCFENYIKHFLHTFTLEFMFSCNVHNQFSG